MDEKQKNETYWEGRMEYLRDSRKDLWNPDYFAFLVEHVWRIDTPINIVDFGCGMGYMGSVLLPLLPKGSTYTGIDIGAKLLEEGRNAFAGSPWKVDFIEQDLTQYEPIKQYDLAICQGVLVHIPSPAMILEKMVRSVVLGGRVICIEPNWAFSSMGVYRHGMEVYSYEDAGTHQKLYDYWVQKGEADRYVGIKIPAMMHDFGLKNIDMRINDKANFYFSSPDNAKLEKDRTTRREKRFNNPDFYMGGGLSRAEAVRHVENILLTEDFEHSQSNPQPVVSAMAWLVSYGEK
ncbi:MAG: class I SAM-dependent methyltransferase [Defluviitaleaceae bacterium]|nr:class I SAM-dependent methyltransferase [Defluviitaleaceae bacterium]